MKFLDPDAQLGYLVACVAHDVSRAWYAALRRHRINPRQFSVLASLAREPTLSQAELARRVMITPQSMSDSIASLVDAGLLARGEVGPGRAARLELAGPGRDILRRAYPVVEAINDASFAALSPSERKTLGELLRKLLPWSRSSGSAASQETPTTSRPESRRRRSANSAPARQPRGPHHRSRRGD